MGCEPDDRQTYLLLLSQLYILIFYAGMASLLGRMVWHNHPLHIVALCQTKLHYWHQFCAVWNIWHRLLFGSSNSNCKNVVQNHFYSLLCTIFPRFCANWNISHSLLYLSRQILIARMLLRITFILYRVLCTVFSICQGATSGETCPIIS